MVKAGGEARSNTAAGYNLSSGGIRLNCNSTLLDTYRALLQITNLQRAYLELIRMFRYLRSEMERQLEWSCIPEETENRKPLYILLIVLVFCIFCILCVLSHPAVAQLPQSLYFPCLGAAFAALCSAVWFGNRQGRGE